VGRKKSPRRLAQREHVRDLERLAELEPGGKPENPIEVDTPAVIDVMAEQKPCPLCQGNLRLLEHAAETIEGERLRVAHVTCTNCGIPREIYFRLTVSMLN
jgi:hypothetical protein